VTTIRDLPTSDATPRAAAVVAAPAGAATVDIVVPVYNEAHALDTSVRRLHAYLEREFPFSWRITIVDNASTDDTFEIATTLAARLQHVHAIRLESKGRGLALRDAWLRSDSQVVAYMDVDLSTDLDAFLPLVAPLVSGHSDVSVGSRLAPGAAVARGPRREVISRAYNLLLRTVFATQVRDMQCGFKALRGDVARRIVPAVEDDGWFFDTELLLLAERNGLRIHQVPVDWVDDKDSRVDVVHTAIGDLKGAARMLRTFLAGGGRVELGAAARPALDDDFGRRMVSFVAIGTISSAISLVIYLALHGALTPVGANAVAVTATFAANTWAHARFTQRAARPRWLRAIALYLGSLATTSVALVAVSAAGLGLIAELAVLALAWAGTALVRLRLLEPTTATRITPVP
jgi:glycosyltransferase involved in cell wall biosynthesis